MTSPTTSAVASAARDNPWKALEYFRAVEASRFYGRQREIAEVTSLVRTGRTLVIYGRSGAGKTSLLLAGVMPELARRDYLPVHVRLRRAPLDDTREAVFEARAAAADPPDPGGDLPALLAAARRPVVLVFDQLEELFIRFAGEAGPLLDALGFVLDAPEGGDARTRCVFSIREEHVARLDDLGPAFGDLLERRYRVRGLSRAGAEEVIARTLEAAHIDASPRFTAKLLRLLEKDGFDPAALQIVCTELYDATRAREHEVDFLDEDDLDAVKDGVFGRSLGRASARAGGDHLTLSIVLDGLITPQHTKLATTSAALAAPERPFRVEPDALRRVLALLEEERVLRREAIGPPGATVDWYELAHDKLVPFVEADLAADRDFADLRFARDLLGALRRNDGWPLRPEKLLAGGLLGAISDKALQYLKLAPEDEERIVRCAVMSRHMVQGRWIDRVGAARAKAVFESMLRDDDAGVRAAAARAAGELAKARRFDDLDRLLLDRAIEDPDAEVRREAGRAFARVTRDDDGALKPLAKRLAQKRSREAAVDVLARVGGERALPAELFRRGERVLATRRYRALRAAESSTEIAVSVRNAFGLGAKAGLLWTPTVGLLLLVWGFWSAHSLIVPLAGMSAVVLVAMVVAGGVSHLAAPAAAEALIFADARQLALRKWVELSVQWKVFVIPFFLLAVGSALGAAVLKDEGARSSTAMFSLLVLLQLPIALAVMMGAALLAGALRRALPRLQPIWLSLLCSAAAAVVAGALSALLAHLVLPAATAGLPAWLAAVVSASALGAINGIAVVATRRASGSHQPI